MIKKFKAWRQKRADAKDNEAFNRGYNWAAGVLLRRETSPAQIEYYSGRQKDPFDQGAEAATDRLCTLGFIVDNRYIVEPSK